MPLLNVLDEVEHHLERGRTALCASSQMGWSFTIPTLMQFRDYLNTEAFLSPMREITGLQDLTHTWVEATCYQSCCFLGGHRDDRNNALNRVAFVFNLTPHWELDSGGLLMLGNDSTHPVIIPPLWNSLSMLLCHAITWSLS